MRSQSVISFVFVVLCSACVDRITIDTGTVSTYPVVIDGFISDQPGPYTIQVTKAYDIESKLSTKAPVSLRKLTISDNAGTVEVMTEVSQGVYKTSAAGIKGTIGRAYKIRIELLDGRIYESIPDTLTLAGTVDKVYFDFKSEVTTSGANQYGFDVLFNSTSGEKTNFHFLWKFTGTFQSTTNPELHDEPCGQSRCPKPPPCSGYIYTAGALQYVRACACCTCWYNIFNDEPIVSDGQFVDGGVFRGVKASYVPITQWTFMYKVHAQVDQMSLSPRAYEFWKGVKAQKSATASLFQPVTGKIVSNFTQISGPTAPIEGLFYSTAITSNSVFITQQDIPIKNIIPAVEIPFQDNCTSLFPNATTTKPSYWVD